VSIIFADVIGGREPAGFDRHADRVRGDHGMLAAMILRSL
jgi:hypothetical protein